MNTKRLKLLIEVFFLCFSVCCKLSIMSMYYFYNQKNIKHLNIFYNALLTFKSIIKIYPLKTM